MECAQFKNHEDAASQLADKLGAYRGTNPLVLAFPGESWAMGAALARALRGELGNALAVRIFGPKGKIAHQDRRDCAAIYGADIRPSHIKGKTVILLAEDISTGTTLLAIAGELRRQGAGRVVAASAVGFLDSTQRLRQEMDETIVLVENEALEPVADFFSDSTKAGLEP